MKTTVFALLFGFFCFACEARSADVAGGEGLGSGEHFPYDLKIWKGKEQLVTRLAKKSEVYEFVRVSKEEFQVRQSGDAGEIFFRFNTEFLDGGVILANGRLVDLLKTQETVSALMYGDQGYFLIEATKNAPELKRGQIYIIPKPIRVHHWNRTFLARSTDYYQDLMEVRYPLSEKIASASLLESRKIEFVYRDQNGKKGVADVFHFKGDTLFKNGKELRKAVVFEFIGNEKSWLSGLESALHDKDSRAKHQKYYDKDELLLAFSNASSTEIHKKLVTLVEELYGQTKK